MKYSFKTNSRSQEKVSDKIREYLEDKSFGSNKEYKAVILGLLRLIKKLDIPSLKTPTYDQEIGPIKKKRALTERTKWGGVALKEVDVAKNHIRKLLVVGRLGVLGFEYHKFKHEKLKVLEGICLVIYSNHKSKDWKKGEVNYSLAKTGDQFEFLPYDEHGMIALTDCVIEETSTNHLDDLIFIYTA